jgi:hypothetical protein
MVEAPEHAAALGEKVMTALDSVANLPHAGACFATLGRLQAEASPLGTCVRRLVAVSAIRLRLWQGATIHRG